MRTQKEMKDTSNVNVKASVYMHVFYKNFFVSPLSFSFDAAHAAGKVNEK